MGRTRTLRGAFDFHLGGSATFGVGGENHIWSYESSDRTRAWKVRFARVWIQTGLTGTLGGAGRSLVQFTLSTDTLGAIPAGSSPVMQEWEERMGAGDNRTIGWGTFDYQNRDNVDADMILPGQGWDGEILLDDDRILTRDLYIQSFGLTENSGTAANRPLIANYYIELEEISISPSHSVLQQLKGIGQNTEN